VIDPAKLATVVPAPVRTICARLQGAGFEAVTVGGAVRDALLGRNPGDWDVATSAPPDAVQRLFPRTIPTGIPHGTVTVIEGRGRNRALVEVTTFRGEGGYSDARRPDYVVFGVSLEQDLARRDFVVNAIAYDPVGGELRDPLGGVADIERRRLRAVGNASTRFAEDGLRVMRAVRLIATLDFDLDLATEEAIEGALPALARVAAERVRVELFKLLGASRPGPALEIARRRGVLGLILPELSTVDWPSALAAVIAAPADASLRLGILFTFAPKGTDEMVDEAMRRLTLSNSDRERVVRLAKLSCRDDRALGDDFELRRLLGEAGRDRGAPDLIEFWRAIERADLASRAAHLLQRGDPLSLGELVISGADLLEAAGMAPGPEVGRVLRALLEEVLRDPALNHRETLLAHARNLVGR
jgi:tRNA nucleotidyltransferase (CCA-adding enzyme)